VLFAAGVALAYFVVVPLALGFSMSFQTEAMEQSIVAGEYLAVVTRLLLAFGIVFELPVVILVLAMLGLVTPEMLAAKRRYAVATITVLACVLTPGDVNSSLFMMVPMIILYEVGIVLARIFGRSRAVAEPVLEA
jgi:sec-independent protein translocase protein TatC